MAKKDKKQKKDKSADGGQTLLDGELMTPEFRAWFIAMPDDNEKFTVTAIFDNDDCNLKPMQKLVEQALKDEFGKDAEPDDYHLPFNDGDKRARKKGQKEFENSTYCSMKTNYAPEVVDMDGNTIQLDDKSELYHGAYYRAVINTYTYENKDNDGVSFGLQMLQKTRNGKKIKHGGRTPEQARNAFNDGFKPKKSKGDDDDKGGKKDKKKKKK